MKALIYYGPGQRKSETKPKPTMRRRGDAIVRMTRSTICGDVHILKGDVASVTPDRVLGHEGMGVIDAVGSRGFTRLARLRGAARRQPRRTPSIDAADWRGPQAETNHVLVRIVSAFA